ncbi:RES domain-containing protein [Pleurocapsa sp. CCALA 161]|uniref:RES family NAD+ phosphorylase n=1 Tax=Pleurocapsa sp. CCALA 161 TaxID=2107688 RepID=UPI000D060244|nr:RES family NAD+ phosphorylase [Pleurocapsa sp. CCALA 161]PSB11617.1 RES domain-containing protein [Pleurocapsa sp. CCALA 161]
MANSHPEPPLDFERQVLPVTLESGLFYRLNPAGYASAIYYDASGCGRFDIKGQLGVLYLGKTIEAAFIETFGRNLGQRFVSRDMIKTRSLFAIESDRPLKLLQLYGAGLAKLGVDSELSSGREYRLPRLWCEAIYSHPQQVDGIYYLSRHDNTQLCCGLFDRGSYRLRENNLGNLLSYDRQKFFEILDRYGFGTD